MVSCLSSLHVHKLHELSQVSEGESEAVSMSLPHNGFIELCVPATLWSRSSCLAGNTRSEWNGLRSHLHLRRIAAPKQIPAKTGRSNLYQLMQRIALLQPLGTLDIYFTMPKFETEAVLCGLSLKTFVTNCFFYIACVTNKCIVPWYYYLPTNVMYVTFKPRY